MVVILSLRKHSFFPIYFETLLNRIRNMIDRPASKHRYDSPEAGRKSIIHATLASLPTFLTVIHAIDKCNCDGISYRKIKWIIMSSCRPAPLASSRGYRKNQRISLKVQSLVVQAVHWSELPLTSSLLSASSHKKTRSITAARAQQVHSYFDRSYSSLLSSWSSSPQQSIR